MEVELLIMYLKPELLILVAALYFIGDSMKKTPLIQDELIPFILSGISFVLCTIYIFGFCEINGIQSVLIALFDAVIQAICCAAGSVYIDQLFKQKEKLDAKKAADDHEPKTK
jgi:hypothetical protein